MGGCFVYIHIYLCGGKIITVSVGYEAFVMLAFWTMTGIYLNRISCTKVLLSW